MQNKPYEASSPSLLQTALSEYNVVEKYAGSENLVPVKKNKPDMYLSWMMESLVRNQPSLRGGELNNYTSYIALAEAAGLEREVGIVAFGKEQLGEIQMKYQGGFEGPWKKRTVNELAEELRTCSESLASSQDNEDRGMAAELKSLAAEIQEVQRGLVQE